jgi:hypothetical protein
MWQPELGSADGPDQRGDGTQLCGF